MTDRKMGHAAVHYDKRVKPPFKHTLLSVIVPVHNVESWVTDCIQSIQMQAVESMEIVVVDDNSTDQTVELVRAMALNDTRIRLFQNPGVGGASARNHGVAVASGRFLAFADGDDIVPRNAFLTLLSSLQESGSNMAMGDHVVFTPERTWRRQETLGIYGEPRHRITVEEEPLILRDRVCWGKVFDAKWWAWNSIQFADSRRSNDIQAMTRAFACATVDILPTVVYCYRMRVGRTSMTSHRNEPASLHAHFQQELSCYQVLAESTSPAVLNAYFIGILNFDVWSHARTLVDRPSAPVSDEERAVCALIAQLVAAAPESAWAALSYKQRWAYRIIASGELDLMANLHGHPEFQLLFADPSEIDAHFANLERLKAVLGDASAHLFPTILRERLLADLSTIWHDLDDATLLERSQVLLDFQRRFVARTRLRPLELAAIDAVNSREPDALRLALSLLAIEIGALKVRVGAGGAMIAESAQELPELFLSRPDFRYSLVAVGSRSTEYELPRRLQRQASDSTSWRHRIPARTTLTPGRWKIVHSWQLGQQRLHLPADTAAHHITSTKPTHWAFWTIDGAGNEVLLHVKPTVWKRVRPRLGSLKRRVLRRLTRA